MGAQAIGPYQTLTDPASRSAITGRREVFGEPTLPEEQGGLA
jgi:hypothetical protein